MHPSHLLNPTIAHLEEYTPIQPFEVLSARLGIPAAQIVKLDANENPYGPIPAVREALTEYAYYHIYPDPQQSELREALSGFVGVPAANILPGHGADELLDYLGRLFLAPGDAIQNTPPTFGMYSFDAKLQGAKVVNVWRRADFSVDVEAIEFSIFNSQFTTKLLFLTSPNNPSGNLLSDADLRQLLTLPVMVILDEAYIEFADAPSRASWVLEYDNLVVLRTFSKAAGIAGLRLGYGIFPLWLLEKLWTFKQPYNVNVAATVAGLASLRHVEQIYDVVEKLKNERDRLFAALQTIPYLRPIPSQANFILCRVEGRRARELKLALEARGILVRHYDKPGLDNCIRVSVGRPDQTDRLVAALRAV
ncbi:MAG: histidinol-phosphate transaminase [Caldilineaceae bacterium]|nr:histidinol-phosphate transaminase [Caldilineaceae bacterium]MBP8108286.1 histidinol-phosphate transaminase [Caldilineaceae bacterium]MBP8123155.1 histidinol-phosphate transaminase [Caldilineaceae bacterium]MBP9073497.1 histidinol-phosphate transaminase [Caldilineaceae bacterium]